MELVSVRPAVNQTVDLPQQAVALLLGVEEVVPHERGVLLLGKRLEELLLAAGERRVLQDLVDVDADVVVQFEHLAHQILGVFGDVFRNGNRFGVEVLPHFLDVLRLKGRHAGEHLVHQDAQTPYVNLAVVLGVEDDFRGHVLVSPADAGAVVVVVLQLARPAEIAQLYLKLIVQEEVLRLDVSMHQSLIMEVF